MCVVLAIHYLCPSHAHDSFHTVEPYYTCIMSNLYLHGFLNLLMHARRTVLLHVVEQPGHYLPR